jgi:hypothetical protein
MPAATFLISSVDAVSENPNEYSVLRATLATSTISCLLISAGVRVLLHPFGDCTSAMTLEMTLDATASVGGFSGFSRQARV